MLSPNHRVVARLLTPLAICAFACLAASAHHSAPYRPAQQQPAPVPGQISGHVYRADTGEPVPKAVVSLIPRFAANSGGRRGPSPDQSGQPDARSVLTAGDGSFTISDVLPGTYTVRSSHVGFIAQTYGQDRTHGPSTVQLGSSQTLDHIDIRMTPAGVIAGTVVDQDGDPLQGMQVSAEQVRYQPGGSMRENTVNSESTDDQGNFRLSGLDPGTYLLGVSPASSLGGIPPAVTYPQTYYPGGALSIDAAEHLEIHAGQNLTGLHIALTALPTHTINGIVFDESGDAGGRRRYILSVVSGGLVSRGGGAVRPDGTFAIRGLPPGDYVIAATSVARGGDGDSTASIGTGFATVQLGDSDTNISIEIGRAAEIRGNVMEATGQSAAFVGKRLMLQPSQDSSSPRMIPGGGGSTLGTPPLDSSGSFDFKEVPPGHYHFSLGGQNTQGSVYVKQASCSGRDYTDVPLEVQSSSVLDRCQIILGSDTGSVSGQVTDGTNATPGQVVILVPASRQLRQVARYTVTATSDNYGNFTLSGVVPGDYVLFATDPRDDQAYFSIDFPEVHSHDTLSISVASNQSQPVVLHPISLSSQ
jgi:protocatechuate 3,4-dioxygenase beta subunit